LRISCETSIIFDFVGPTGDSEGTNKGPLGDPQVIHRVPTAHSQGTHNATGDSQGTHRGPLFGPQRKERKDELQPKNLDFALVPDSEKKLELGPL